MYYKAVFKSSSQQTVTIIEVLNPILAGEGGGGRNPAP